MKIGNVELKNNIFLAPMAGVTDLPFRLICAEMGCGLVYSEMISAKGMFYGGGNTQRLLCSSENERPLAVQIFGSSPEIMGQMAKSLEDAPVDVIDVNMGCPAPKIVKNGDGSALMKNPELVGEIVRTLVEAQSKPVTIKIRKGFDDSCVNAVEIAQIAEENGAAAVAVHGRTRQQYYSGKADWDIIKKVKKAVSIPVIGNGDVFTPQDAKNLIDHTKCDAIMIGRGAQGNPWIFGHAKHYIETGELLPPPELSEKGAVAMRHFNMLTELKGEYIAVREMRRHLADYIKGINGAAQMRVLVNSAETAADMKMYIEKFFMSS
ncbi:MAG: tRNA dihydrouridine synthase DusB [Firmicutes bacterium]|nr:tRNA dihydrouridine synthase DusB [Bacillota bacterium]